MLQGIKKHFGIALLVMAISSALILGAQQAPAGQGGARGQRGGQAQQAPPAAPAPPRGLEIAGEVQNFTPVTDAMLRNPDPGDWPMIRRDYHANNFSPLKQITADNVGDLQLVWKSPMNEGGTNQPAPIVHNGVIY